MKINYIVITLIVLLSFLVACANTEVKQDVANQTQDVTPQKDLQNKPPVNLQEDNGKLVTKCDGLTTSDLTNYCNLKTEQFTFYLKEEGSKHSCNIKLKDSNDLIGQITEERNSIMSIQDFINKYKDQPNSILIQKNIGLGDASYYTRSSDNSQYVIRFYKHKVDAALIFNKNCRNIDTSIQNMAELVEQTIT